MTSPVSNPLKDHAVVPHDEWIRARTAFLAREKEFTRLRDELSRARRELPWERVEKPYVFDGPEGQASLADLFADKSQLVVYQFMFNPTGEEGCKHCSFWADNFNPNLVHLKHRDVAFVAVSRAPQEKIRRFRERMGWSFPWFSSQGTDYNYDFQASFHPADIEAGKVFYNYRTGDMPMADREGVSVFYKAPDGAIYHTYSAYARGIDILNTAYNYLDLVPKGRDEDGLEFTQSWVRYHDRYEDAGR